MTGPKEEQQIENKVETILMQVYSANKEDTITSSLKEYKTKHIGLIL